MDTKKPQDSAAPTGAASALSAVFGVKMLGWWHADPDAGNAWLMTVAFAITAGGVIFSHGNWLATWFAFSAAWFAWRVVVVKKMRPNVELSGGPAVSSPERPA